MKERAITLAQLLQAREDRQSYQRELLAEFGLPLVSFTVVAPTAVKRTPNTLFVAKSGVLAIGEAFGGKVKFFAERDLFTGYEGFFVIDGEQQSVKKLAVQIEDNHPLGRLFDVDVIGIDGAPISRQSVNKPKRKCLVCNRDADICVRSRAHDGIQVLYEINELINRYKDKIKG